MRWRPLRTIAGIAGAFVVAVTAATVGTGIGVYLVLLRTIDHQVERRLQAEADEILGFYHPEDLRPLAHKIALENAQRDSGDIGITLYDAAGRPVAGNVRLSRALPNGFSALSRADGIAGLSRGRALKRTLPSGVMLILAAESEPIEDYDESRVAILTIGFATALVLILSGIVLLAITVGRRIDAVRLTADAIVDGDMRRRVPRDGSRSAFDRQAEAFNRMLDRIEALVASLANVSSDVAHDLRTPLARLRTQLRAMADRAEAEPVRAEIEEAVAQSDEILALFAAILRIAEVEGGERRARFAPLDLAALVETVADGLIGMVEDAGDTLEVCTEPVRVEGDQALLYQLLVNLVENAVHHAPPGTTIRIDLARHGESAALTVSDNGPGIPASQHAQALRRFGRLDHSRNTPGHGLGLPMAEAIVRLHQGSLRLDDAAPGLAVRIRLPALAQ